MELYYYTTTDTLRFILEKGDIYATNIRYMNDSEEYINGVTELWQLANNQNLVEKWLKRRENSNLTQEKIKNIFTQDKLKKNMENMEFYSISFCQKNDLLSQWAIYARESGVSIKMRFNKQSYSFSTESTEIKSGKREKERAQWKCIPQKVYYFTHGTMAECQKEYENRAFDILNQLYPQSTKDSEEGMDERWRYISTYVKRYDFYQEAESRLVFQPGKTVYPPKIQYRCDKKVLKPYLDIECEGGWPIWEIMIGPGFNQEVVYNSVVHFLEHSVVKNGVASSLDYIQRVKEYFKPFANELEKNELYKEIAPYFSSTASTDKIELDEARIMFGTKIKLLCDSIHAEQCNEKLWKYIENHRFTNSGIVVSKSSIPYLF